MNIWIWITVIYVVWWSRKFWKNFHLQSCSRCLIIFTPKWPDNEKISSKWLFFKWAKSNWKRAITIPKIVGLAELHPFGPHFWNKANPTFYSDPSFDYCTIQYNAIHYSAVKYYTVLYSTIAWKKSNVQSWTNATKNKIGNECKLYKNHQTAQHPGLLS